MISLFMHGGPSHVDLLDPKPELATHHGKDYSGDVVFSFVNRASKKLFGSPWKFAKHGEAGTDVSELLPEIAGIADDLCLIRSMHTGHNGHEVSIRYFHGGVAGITGRPTLGSWITYALGSESQELPAYMVLSDPGGPPVDGTHNWASGFLPPLYQGTVLRPQEPRILNLDPPPHLRGEVPGAWRAQPGTRVEVQVDLGFSPSQPGFQAEALAYRPDGTPIKSIQPRNAWVPWRPEDGDRIDVLLEAAANPDVASDWRFRPTPLGDCPGLLRELLLPPEGACGRDDRPLEVIRHRCTPCRPTTPLSSRGRVSKA